eukprot:g8770.t1
MWCYGEIDSRVGIPAYGCVEIEDNNFAMQPPTFMTQQGLEPLFDEGCFSSALSDNYCDVISQTTVVPTEQQTALIHQTNYSNGSMRNYGLNQDTSGTDSSVCCYPTTAITEHSFENGQERKQYYHQSNTAQLQMNNDQRLDTLTNVCLLPQEVLHCLQNSAGEAIYGAPVNVSWFPDDNETQFIKKECSSPTRQNEPTIQHFVSGPVRAPAVVNRHTNEETTRLANVQFSDVTGALLSTGMSSHSIRPSQMTSSFAAIPSVVSPVKPNHHHHHHGSRVRIGKLSSEQNLLRRAKVARYLEKRKRRNWGHTIRYASRKAYAENRPRIKGRFARQEEVDALHRQLKLESDDQS